MDYPSPFCINGSSRGSKIIYNSPYATRNFFGLCPLMSGKALPFRQSYLKS